MKRSVFFDVLRAVCILNVIAVIHARQYSARLCQAIDSHFPAWGYIVGTMAALFFASGYLLAKSNTIDNAHDALLFAKKRILRILPLYVLSLLTIPFPAPMWRKATMLLGINNFMGFSLSTLWFVSVLMVFYVLFPIMRVVKRRRGWGALILLSLLVEILFAAGGKFLDFEARLSYYFPFFMLGIVAADLNVPERRIFLVAASVSAIYLVSRLAGLFDGVEVVLRPLRFFVVLSAAYVVSVILPRGKAWGVLAYASFCAYLFHRQFYDLALHRWFPGLGGQAKIALIYLLVPLTFVAGYAIQWGYDCLLNHAKRCGGK